MNKWFCVETHWYNVAYLQEFYWHDGALFIVMSGRSVPEVIHDPDAEIYKKLYNLI